MSHYDCKYCGCSPGDQHQLDCPLHFKNIERQTYKIDYVPSWPRMIDQILDERLRQIKAKAYTPHHDDLHTHGELAQAAAFYALIGAGNTINHPRNLCRANLLWPWPAPMPTLPAPRRALIIAAALIIAEIERLDRAEARAPVTEADLPF